MEIGAGDHGHHSAQQVPPTCSGWLRKRRGKASSWKERFFVLRGSNLLYYLKPTDGVRILLLDLTMKCGSLVTPARTMCFVVAIGAKGYLKSERFMQSVRN
jgi:hypothetical protein